MYFRIAIVISVLTLSACSSWVFRYDIAQGNYLDKKSIKKIQIDMTKEQVKFVLGSPVVVDAFSNDTWHYVYRLKSGRDDSYNIQRKLIINFVDDKIVSASGDYDLSENFNTPFNIDAIQKTDLEGANSSEEDIAQDVDFEAIATDDEIEQAAEDAIEEAGLEAEARDE